MTPDYGSEMSWNLHRDVPIKSFIRFPWMPSNLMCICDKCKKTWTPFEMKEAQIDKPGMIKFCCPDCERD